jgi:hypothetical protein
MPEQDDRWHRPSAAELRQRRIERAQREAAEEAARKETPQIVERWIRALAAGRGSLWSPTIRAAVLACGVPWLDVYCPGCRTGRALDIRAIDRHPLASVGSLVLGLRCSLCRGLGGRILTASDVQTARLWDSDGRLLAAQLGRQGSVPRAQAIPALRRAGAANVFPISCSVLAARRMSCSKSVKYLKSLIEVHIPPARWDCSAQQDALCDP